MTQEGQLCNSPRELCKFREEKIIYNLQFVKNSFQWTLESSLPPVREIVTGFYKNNTQSLI